MYDVAVIVLRHAHSIIIAVISMSFSISSAHLAQNLFLLPLGTKLWKVLKNLIVILYLV